MRVDSRSVGKHFAAVVKVDTPWTSVYKLTFADCDLALACSRASTPSSTASNKRSLPLFIAAFPGIKRRHRKLTGVTKACMEQKFGFLNCKRERAGRRGVREGLTR